MYLFITNWKLENCTRYPFVGKLSVSIQPEDINSSKSSSHIVVFLLVLVEYVIPSSSSYSSSSPPTNHPSVCLSRRSCSSLARKSMKGIANFPDKGIDGESGTELTFILLQYTTIPIHPANSHGQSSRCPVRISQSSSSISFGMWMCRVGELFCNLFQSPYEIWFQIPYPISLRRRLLVHLRILNNNDQCRGRTGKWKNTSHTVSIPLHCVNLHITARFHGNSQSLLSLISAHPPARI